LNWWKINCAKRLVQLGLGGLIRKAVQKKLLNNEDLRRFDSLIELLEKASIKASKLPEMEQNVIAKWLIDELESEKKWHHRQVEPKALKRLIFQ
jgi:hypothetical protein